ncbi:50S ribosomal protein L32 [Candidatus Falkowbacteria bacterium]|nr:50S ribosomal protein L32 [Candidatus Falkowbacteria bacterium]
MANPKHRKNRSRTRMHRSHHALKLLQLSFCAHCKAPAQPHMVCPSCGYYKGKQIIKTKADVKLKREEKRKKREEKEKQRMQSLKNK